MKKFVLNWIVHRMVTLYINQRYYCCSKTKRIIVAICLLILISSTYTLRTIGVDVRLVRKNVRTECCTINIGTVVPWWCFCIFIFPAIESDSDCERGYKQLTYKIAYLWL